jgi:ubiquinone/menaquinone biosynthesis C-methylase UbiE
MLAQCLAAHGILRRIAGVEMRPTSSAEHAVRRRYAKLLQRDLANAQAGLYPERLLFQLPVSEYARLFPKLVGDFPRSIRRAKQKNYKDLPTDVDLTAYPPYYRRNFHWQTDGYLSERSAELYDVGVEFLFLGMADVMRRQVIPPITRFLNEQPMRRGTNHSARVLDVACGTGSLLRLLGAAKPDLKYFGVDLSPYYIRHAKKRLRELADVTLIAENAECLPFRDAYFDVVTSVHLFHELPRNARRNVYREMLRVLRPGGLLVIEDSAQPADGQEVSFFLERFSDDFHEPFYRDYLRDDVATALGETGFIVHNSEPCFVAKVVVARRPN